MIDDIKINPIPYLGFSKNLMEFFVVIGYDEKMIKDSEPILEKQQNLPLTIISNVTSDLAYNMFEPLIIIKRVYPDKPLIIKSNKMPKQSSVIFSSCIDSNDGTKKVVNSCYALRFYEKYVNSEKEVYYVPKAFLIYSQYPYYNTYYQICHKLWKYYTSDIKNKIPIEILIYCLVNYIPSPINNNIVLTDFGLNLTIPKLTGYPYADFNMIKIFNLVPLKEFIKIYILIYLEIELLFFSPDLAKLNMFMFMLFLLNYPLTDSSYFWHIETISEKDIKSDYHTIMTGFKGINTKYSPNLDLSRFKTVSFIIDLEGDNVIVHRKQTKESKEIAQLIKYIDSILNNKKIGKSFFLQNSLLNLINNLKNIDSEIEIFPAKEIPSDSFFNMDEKINERNQKFQQAFYNFVIDTLIVLNKDLELDPSLKFPVNIKHFKNSSLSSEEKIFLKKTRDTVKYNTYFDLFIRRFSVSDELRVSLLFIDEFVDLKNKDLKDKIQQMPYFQIIENLYHYNKNDYVINFNSLQKEILSNFDAGKTILLKDIDEKSQLFTLKKELIKIFIFQKKNKGYYKSLIRQEEAKPDPILKTSIITVIQDYFFKNYILQKSFFVRSSIVFIFSLTFPLISFSKSIYFLSVVLQGLKKIKYFQRYYIFILLKSISKYYSLNKETQTFPNFTYEKIFNFYKLIQDYLKDNSIVQNEEIFVFFKKLSAEKEKKEQNKKKEKEEKEEKMHFVYHTSEKDEYIEINKEDELVELKHELLIFKRGNEKIFGQKLRTDLLFQQTYSLHDYHFTQYNFNIEYLEVNDVINICINLLYALRNTDDQLIKYHLYNLIPILKRLRNDLNIFNGKKQKMKEQKKEEEKKDEIKKNDNDEEKNEIKINDNDKEKKDEIKKNDNDEEKKENDENDKKENK